MTLTRRKIKSSLLRKGFVIERMKKHILLQFKPAVGNTKIVTIISHGRDSDSLSDNLVSQMARQCMISISDFRGLIDCRVSEEDYVRLVKTRLKVK